MRVISKRALREYWESHPDAEESLTTWYRAAKAADWDGPMSVKAAFPKASIVGNNRVVFNIRGNRYRLVVRIEYRYRTLYVRFLGTHAEYDRVDVSEV